MKNSQLFHFICLLSFCFLTACQSEERKTTEERPNILFVVSDDQSRQHAGAYGCTWINTPNFDRIAKEGLLFNQAYTPSMRVAQFKSTIFLLSNNHPSAL